MNYRKLLHLMVVVTFLLVILLGGLTGLAQAASETTTSRFFLARSTTSLHERPWVTKSPLGVPAAIPANVPLLEGTPVLTITKSSTNEGGASLLPGERITYTITISNSGDISATNVVISDTIPANTTFIPESLELISTSGVTGTPPTLAEGITLDPASLVTITYVVTVNSGLADGTLIVNTAAVTSTEITDPQTSTVTDTVVNQADLSISKTNGQTQSIPGQTITYTIVVVNNSSTTPVTNATVSDVFPAELTSVTWSCTPAGGGSCTASGNSDINDSTVDLPANASVTYIIIGTVSPSATGLLTNTASVTVPSGVTDPTPGNNNAIDSDTLTPKANLAIQKSDSPDPVFVGQPLTYTLTFTNNGPSDATGVVLTDTLPGTVNFDSAVGCSHSSGVVVCTIGSLAAGLSTSRTIVVTPTTAGLITNSAIISSSVSDPDESNNSDTENTTITPHADLTISKSDSPEPVIAGETLTYTLTITNNGPSTAQSLVVTDTLPVSVSLVSVQPATATQTGQTLTWNFASLANGATQSITVVVNVNGSARENLSNTAVVTASTADLSPGNNSDTESTTINSKADLTVSKSDSVDPVQKGILFVYTVQVTNTGPSTALGVVFTDTLPTGMSFSGSFPVTCNNSSGVITCNLGALSKDSSTTVNLFVSHNTPGIYTNTVTTASNEFDPDTSNNTATATTTINPANLSITKVASSPPIRIGTPFTYTLTVANSNSSSNFDATGVILTDTLPAGVNLKTASASQGNCSGTSTIICNLNDLNRGANATVTIVVTPSVAGVITNTATVTSDMPDPTPINNTATITTTVSPVADLSIGKTASSDPVTAGTSLTYTLTVTNSGPSAATGIVISDPLPSGVTFVSASAGCSGSTTINCSISTLNSGSSTSVTIRVNVNSTTTSPLANSATVTGNEFDPNNANNTAALGTGVSRQVNLSIIKTDSPDPVTAGTSLTYTLTISNAGPSSANNVVVTDTLPSGVTLASTSPGCSGTTVVTCTIAGGVASGGTAAVTIRVNVSAASSGVLTNTAMVGSTESDSNLLNNTATITTSVNQRTDLAITKSDSPDPAPADSNLTYNLSVTNNGPSNATGVVMTDTLPAGVTFQSFTVGAPCSHVSGTITCNFGALASGNQATVAIVVKVNNTTTGNLVNNATVTGNQVDPNSNNNSTSATTTVGALSFVYLPLVQKSPPTELSVFNDNTKGNVTFTVLGTGVSCTVPNNTTQFCGSFPPGIYTIQVTSVCGNATSIEAYVSGPKTNRVFCK